MAPWADALYACDETWWDRNRELWQDFKGEKYTWSKQAAKRFNLRHVHGTNAPGLGTRMIHTGGGSGYMAIGLAYFLGAREICLLGFDMQATNGLIHWHGNHKKTSNPSKCMLSRWVEKYPPLAAGLESLGIPLINCTRSTALTIPRKPLESVLAEQ